MAMPQAGGDDGAGEDGGRPISGGIGGSAACGAARGLDQAESRSSKRKAAVMSGDSGSLVGSGAYLNVTSEDSQRILEEIKDLRAQLDKDVKELGYCEANQKLRVEIQYLRKQKEEMQAKYDVMRKPKGDLQAKNDGLAKHNEELQGKRDRLVKEHEVLQNSNDNDDMKKWNKVLQVKNDGLMKQSEELQAKIDGLTKQNEDLQAKNDGLAKLNEMLKDNNVGLTKRREELVAKNDGLTKWNQDMQAKSGSLTKGIEELQVKTDSITKQNEKLKAENDGLMNLNEKLKDNNVGLMQRRKELVAKNDGLAKWNQDLQAKSGRLTKGNEELQAKNNSLIKQNEKLKAKNDGLMKLNVELQANNDKIRKWNMELQANNDGIHKNGLKDGLTGCNDIGTKNSRDIIPESVRHLKKPEPTLCQAASSFKETSHLQAQVTNLKTAVDQLMSNNHTPVKIKAALKELIDDYAADLNKTIMCTGGARGSKRVIPPGVQDQPTRMTRQRIRELPNAQEDASITSHCPTQADAEIQVSNEDGPNVVRDGWGRGKSMCKRLDRSSSGLNTKIPVVVAEGKRRPEAPMQAAKLASESGIIVRQHVPIYTHWKEYKKDKVTCKDYMEKIAATFSIDTNNQAIKYACTDLLKCRQRNMRHQLKKAFFDGIPANQVTTTSPVDTMTDDQWQALVDMWSSPKHKKKCTKAKLSRGNVRLSQKTGSRCFIAHAHVAKQEKYKDAPPTAIDLFKDTHCSSKTGFSEPVQQAIAQMEAIVAEPVEEGQAQKTPVEAVAQVLPSSSFLQNVGLEQAAPKRSAKSAAATVRR